ncbi:hyaluronoglucosaminidase [Ancylostoma ceylanicum]|uniref:Hyaluronidase n=1 Tax=Ancylostoma ceylanicum TaxID=53326 RepID=A0A0D6LTL4_9BILA|nr:hyaluronoglucosaminidase [Ancylostoma ceylanicum]
MPPEQIRSPCRYKLTAERRKRAIENWALYRCGEQIHGDKVVIFYEKKFGLCPYYNNSDPNQPINGGLPQNQTLEQHLAKVEEHIRKEIPDENFDGIAVIDVEEFRPLYSMNWGEKEVYKEQSRLLIKSQYPHFNSMDVEHWAEINYNKAAKRFFVETIKTARRVRPKAKWGYYDYPFCNYKLRNPEGDYECSMEAKGFNDQPTVTPKHYELYRCHCDSGFKGKDCSTESKGVDFEINRIS